MARDRLVIIDGSSLIYRAFFALPPLTTADGTPTNAVYGFTTMLLKILEDEKPDVILMAMEGGKTFRHTEFEGYKAQRPRTPDDLAVQTPIARTMAEAFRVPIVKHDGFEADDVIGTITCAGKAAGFDVLVVTGDLDALQLVNDQVKVMVNRRGITDTMVYDEAAVLERFGLPARLLPDFKALKGDTSDNIPGIPGIGDKTATSLLTEYGSLEQLLDRAGEIKATRVRNELQNRPDDARLYKKLATIVTDLPLETPFAEWKYTGPDVAEVQELCRLLEFRTLGRRVQDLYGRVAPTAAAAEKSTARWKRLEEPEEIAAWAEKARRANGLAVRTWQVGGEGRTGTLRGLALSAAGDTIVIYGDEPEGEGLLAAATDPWEVPEPIRELLADRSVVLLGHDLKREYHALAGRDVRLGQLGFDTLLAAYVLNPGRSAYRLEDLANEYLASGFTEQTGPERLAQETAAIAGLWEPMARRLSEDELDKVYHDLELPLIPILAEMERLGIGIDVRELQRVSRNLGERIQVLEDQAYAAAGRKFNVGSPKQLQEVLFTDLQLPPGKKTKTGYSTDSDVLQDLAVVHPLPAVILEWRELAKLKSTYADALRNLVDPHDGRVHTHLNQTVAATGRLSSSDPNLQNIPIRSEVGREIRSAFVPAAGMKLLSADYSQIELRLMAHICHDPELVRAFQEGRDVHAATAARVFDVPLEQVTSDQRRSAKTVNFAVLYGQSDFGLSRQLRIGRLEARALIDAYFAEFPGVLNYIQSTREHARQHGYVATLPPYRRRRYIPGVHAGNHNERQAAEREAINAPVQGTASDIIKAAMVQVDKAMRGAGMQSRMILQVHDELLFEVVPEEEEALKRLVTTEMESAFELDVPLKVEVKTGRNWRDVEPSA